MPVERTERVIAIWLGSTGNGRNPMFNGRRQPSRGGTSRLTRECQVRFCERLGVIFPRPTRQNPTSRTAKRTADPPDQDMQFWVGCAAVLNRWGHMRINCLRRRQFITLLGGAAAWAVGARAQRSAMPVVGVFGGGSSEGLSRPLVAFRQGLGESGYFERKKCHIEY